MTFFAVDPDTQKADAAERLRLAHTLLDMALESYEKRQSQDNLASLNAALRLIDEAEAEFSEWTA